MKEYALYKGDKLLDIGTLKELSDKFKVKTRTLVTHEQMEQISYRLGE